jgi:hypothetical protein
MPARKLFLMGLAVLAVFSGIIPSRAEEPSMQAKQFPVGYFFPYRKISLAEKEKVLAKVDATLQKLNREGYGLIAKGAVLEKMGPALKIYDKVTVLDESGLIIIAHRVPNLYYQYPGIAGINPNIYLIIKGARVNISESYIRYGYVVEGDYVAYANKFVKAILEGLERAAPGVSRPPVSCPPIPR